MSKQTITIDIDVRDGYELKYNPETRTIEEIKKELFNLKFASATGTLEKPHRIKELRHEVAKIKTVIRERELSSKEEAE